MLVTDSATNALLNEIGMLEQKKSIFGPNICTNGPFRITYVLANRLRHTTVACLMIGHLSDLFYIDQTLKKFLSLSSNILSLFLSVNLYSTCIRSVRNSEMKNKVVDNQTGSHFLLESFLSAGHPQPPTRAVQGIKKKILEPWPRQYFYKIRVQKLKRNSILTKRSGVGHV